MKTFKQHLNERKEHIGAIFGMIDAGRFANAKELVEYLGWKNYIDQIGKGLFSVVFDDMRKSGEYVLKIHNPKRPNLVDVYPQFVKLAQQRDFMNSLYPKVEAFRVFPDGSYAAVLERLEVDKERADSLFKELGDDLYRATKGSLYRAWGPFTYCSYTLFPTLVNNPAAFKGELAEFFTRACELLKVRPSQMRQFVRETHRVPGMVRWDAHQDNIGWRSNGSAVFFDPIV